MSRSLIESCIRKRPVYFGHAVNFYVDEVRLPNGRKAVREYLDHPGAVAVVPFVDADTVVFVRQYRYPVAKTTYEIPAGKLDGRESPRMCIQRELREETGYTAGHLTRLISYWPTPAFSDELLHIYIAQDLVQGSAAPDPDEFLSVVRLPFARALHWALTGKIRDSKTVIALLACALRRVKGLRAATP